MKRPIICRMVVAGQLNDSWADWFDPLQIEPIDLADGTRATLMAGFALDQPALFGLLFKIRDLNLDLVYLEVSKLNDLPGASRFDQKLGS